MTRPRYLCLFCLSLAASIHPAIASQPRIAAAFAHDDVIDMEKRTDPPVKWRRGYKPHRCNDRLEDIFQSLWYGDGMDEYKPWKNAQAKEAIARFMRCMRAHEGFVRSLCVHYDDVHE